MNLYTIYKISYNVGYLIGRGIAGMIKLCNKLHIFSYPIAKFWAWIEEEREY